MRIPSLLSADLGLALIAHTAFAFDVRLYKQGETPNPRDVAAGAASQHQTSMGPT